MAYRGLALVAGGGVAGMTAALALARQGVAVRLFEPAHDNPEAGAGLQLSPNATRILARLGLVESVREIAGAPDALVVRNGLSGRVVVTMPLGNAAEARWGAPSLVAHRADLWAVLRRAVEAEPRIEILPERVTQAGNEAEGATLLAGGRTHDAGLLVGADGLWSSTRGAVLGAAPPRYGGAVAYRATIRTTDAPPDAPATVTGLWLGPNAHVVHYPLRGGTLINVVALVPESEPGAEGDAGRDWTAALARWAPPVRALVAAPPRWTRWPLFDRAPDRRCHHGRIVLVGDAAHPMLPFLAQGASMAIEDAGVLAALLARHDVPEAFPAYAAQRLPRVGRVQREARRNATVFHLSGPAAMVRDFGLRALGPGGLARRYDWVYGAAV